MQVHQSKQYRDEVSALTSNLFSFNSVGAFDQNQVSNIE